MRATILAASLLLLAGCAGQRDVSLTSTTAKGQEAPRQLDPQQVANGLDDLAIRVRERISSVSDRIDEGASNELRRTTLRFRMRASEVAWRAVQNPNKLAGVIELWFWMTVVDEYARQPAVAERLGSKAPILQTLGSDLRADVEAFARQVLPPKGFASIKERIAAAAANGEVLTASPVKEQAIVGDLLEMTQLQNVLGIALSPFEALRGIGTGGDAANSLALTADRAVDLMERYPEIVAWNLRLAVIDMEEQDSAREARAALARSIALAEELPARIRTEVQTLLASSDPALQSAQATLRELTAASAALTALSASIQQTLAAVRELAPPPHPDAPPREPGRPFDIREYTAAIQAAEATLREARGAIAAAESQGLPAAEAAAQRFEAAADRLLLKLGGLIAFAALLAGGLLVLRHRLRTRP